MRVTDLPSWALFAVVTNTGRATIDPRVFDSTLLVNGRASGLWPLTIANGPVDDRWTALPPGDSLDFGRTLQGALFTAGPGRYDIVLRVSGVWSPPLRVAVVP